MTFANPIAPVDLHLVSKIQRQILSTLKESFMDRPFDLVRVCHGSPVWDSNNLLAIYAKRFYHASPMGLPKTRTMDKATIPAIELAVVLVRPVRNLDGDGVQPTDAEVTEDATDLVDDGARLQRVLVRAAFDGTLFPGLAPDRFTFKELRPTANGDAGGWEYNFDLMLA